VSLTVGELAGLGGLGDHMRIGPQWAWPTHQGTPIIQRGPHGQRFAPIPSNSPGTGVRFWRESEGDFATQGWAPRAAVVGVMGMGAGLPELSETGRNGITKIARMLDDEVGAASLGDVATLRSIDQRARLALETLGKYQAFESSWIPVRAGGWDSSTTVRATLQKVLVDARDKASGRVPPDRSSRSPAAAAALEAAGSLPSGIPGLSVAEAAELAAKAKVAADDAAAAAIQAGEDALAAAKRAYEETLEKGEQAVKVGAIVGGVVLVVGGIALGAYALNALTGAKRAFSPLVPGANPRRRRSAAVSHPARPASFRYE
jgi:hypothetical protein